MLPYRKTSRQVSYLLLIMFLLMIVTPVNVFAAAPASPTSDHSFKTLHQNQFTQRGKKPVDLNADPLANAKYKQGEILVKFKESVNSTEKKEIVRNSTFLKDFPRTGISLVKINSAADLSSELKRLKADKRVKFAEPNYETKAQFIPNDTSYSQQWALSKINAPSAWDITKGSPTVKVAVIDSGVDYTHPDLAANTLPGYDFYNVDSDPYDDNGHGTHVSGIIAGVINNGTGIAGLAPNVKIMPLKVLDSTGNGYVSDEVLAIEYAADNGAQVINLSLGGSGYSSSLEDAVEYASNMGVVVVAAAGNNGDSNDYYPSSSPYAISVGSTDSFDSKSYFSNYGETVDLVSPGENILSTRPGATYATGSGTSFAAPHASALAALLLSKYPAASPGRIEQYMKDSAVDLGAAGRDDNYGFGRIDAYKALTVSLKNGDAYEPNDTQLTAKSIGSGTLNATVYPAQDFDVYSINVPAGKTLVAKLTPPKELDPVLEIYDANLNLVGQFDNIGLGVAESGYYTSSSGGTYYVVATDYYGSSSQNVYSLQVTLTDDPVPPAVTSITPNSGTSQPSVATTFTSTYSDANGFLDIDNVYFLFEPEQPSDPSFLAMYNRPSNKLYLSNDTLTGFLPTTTTPGSVTNLSNSFVTLNSLGTTISGSGNNLTVNWNLTFKPSMSGKRYSINLIAEDIIGNSSGAVVAGNWIVNRRPGFYPPNPSTISAKAGTPFSIPVTYVDSDGYTNLQGVYYLINFEMAKSIVLQYNPDTNKLYMRDDQGILWLGGITPGTVGGTISNSYATLDVANTTVSSTGTNVVVNWRLTPKTLFAGKTYQMFMYVRDDVDEFKGWQGVGSITIAK